MRKSFAWTAAVVFGFGLCVRSGGFSFLLAANYLPHQFCYLAQPGLVWTNVVMDG